MKDNILDEAIAWVLIAIAVFYIAPAVPLMLDFIATRFEQDFQEVRK